MDWLEIFFAFLVLVVTISMSVSLFYEYVLHVKKKWQPKHTFIAGIIGGMCLLPFLAINVFYVLIKGKIEMGAGGGIFNKDMPWFPEKPLVSYDGMRKTIYSFLFRE